MFFLLFIFENKHKGFLYKEIFHSQPNFKLHFVKYIMQIENILIKIYFPDTVKTILIQKQVIVLGFFFIVSCLGFPLVWKKEGKEIQLINNKYTF